MHGVVEARVSKEDSPDPSKRKNRGSRIEMQGSFIVILKRLVREWGNHCILVEKALYFGDRKILLSPFLRLTGEGRIFYTCPEKEIL